MTGSPLTYLLKSIAALIELKKNNFEKNIIIMYNNFFHPFLEFYSHTLIFIHMEFVDRGLDHRVQFERGIPIDLHEFTGEMLCDGNTFV